MALICQAWSYTYNSTASATRKDLDLAVASANKSSFFATEGSNFADTVADFMSSSL